MGMLFFHFFPPPPTPPRGKMAALLADSTPTALASQIFFRARVARVRVYGSMCFDIALRYDIARSDMLNAAAASFSSSMACAGPAARSATRHHSHHCSTTKMATSFQDPTANGARLYITSPNRHKGHMTLVWAAGRCRWRAARNCAKSKMRSVCRSADPPGLRTTRP